MNKKTERLESWIQQHRELWKQQSVILEPAKLNREHQMCANVHSPQGIGKITLYEQDGQCYIEFQAATYDYDVMFSRIQIKLEHSEQEEQAFLTYLCEE